MDPLARVFAPFFGALVGLAPSNTPPPRRDPAPVVVPAPRPKPPVPAAAAKANVLPGVQLALFTPPATPPNYPATSTLFAGATPALSGGAFVGGTSGTPPPIPRPRPNIARASSVAGLSPTASTPPPKIGAPAADASLRGSSDLKVASIPPNPRAASTDDAKCVAELSQLKVQFKVLPSNQNGSCGMKTPLQVSASLDTGGIRFTPVPTMNCSETRAVLDWLNQEVQPAAMAHLGGPITGIQVADSYSCRSVDHIPGAKLSEHAVGNALDISAFQVGTGKEAHWVQVEARKDSKAPEAQFLNQVRKAACAYFTTVLGPGQPEHDKHFHLDNARHGSSGTYRICE